MAARKFRFVSPGVFLKEIDQSQIPGIPEGIGPVIIGRTRKGPALKPYKIRSMEEFNRVFGAPMPGNQGEDPWRDGTHLLAESYAPYAAKAYLAAEIDSPVTIVRLAGIAGDDANATTGEPGWDVDNAHGLFFCKSGGSSAEPKDLELAAIFYGQADFVLKAKGMAVKPAVADAEETIAKKPILFNNNREITLELGDGSSTKEVTFSFDDIRKSFNTNPVMVNTDIASPPAGDLSAKYWLGESFHQVWKKFDANVKATESKAFFTAPLATLMEDFKSKSHGLTAARTGWIFGQMDSTLTSTYSPDNVRKLFRLIALHEGQDAMKDLIIAIEDIKLPRAGAVDRFGTFAVVIKRILSTRLEEIERFDDCNLNPNSQNFIAKKIGDQYFEWSASEKRNKLYGGNINLSEYIRVDVDPDLEGNPAAEIVPFGFYGPIRPKTSVKAGTPGAAAGSITPDASWIPASALDLHDLNTNTDGASIPTKGELTVNLKWPAAPLITSGSRESGFVMGVTPYELGYSSGSNSLSDAPILDTGYMDYLRRLPSLDSNALVADQDTGLLTANKPTEYSFKFSMEDVVLANAPNVADANIDSPTDVSAVHYLEGSRNTLTAATVTINAANAPDPGQTIILKATDGTSATFTVHATVNSATTFARDGTKNGLDNLKSAIALSPLADKLSVEAPTGTDPYAMVITQVVKGSEGNTVIENNLANWDINGGTVTLNGAFTGGTGTDAGTSWAQKCAADPSLELRRLFDIVDGFHLPLAGGSDGVDITEANPFNMRTISSDSTTANSYAFASVDRALELIKNPEMIEHNLAVMPGITNESLTSKLVSTCEARADSLAIIDLPDIYKPPSQAKCTVFKDRVKATTPEKSAAALVKRQINSSYGCTYYPWVKVKDTQFNRDVWVPPSVVALGVMAYTEKRDDVWFAPAGFNRGGLNQGNAGLPVLQVSEQLLSKDRDTLYQANINPVASFVSEGIVIFGQKTLQSTQSALDRINVRRLLIFVKKMVSRVSNNLLFEQNVQATWKRFTNQVVPELESIKTRFGLSDFKVVLDSTTTTPDLIDRNIMYAKVFLKPARAIEFIAVDFVITNTGASFED